MYNYTPQQQQALQQQYQAQLQQLQQQGGAAVQSEVGQARVVRIDGCKHEVVGPIIRGDYTLTQMNHGKPAYQKEGGTGQSTTVMIYFWDERDGVASSGWWIGPQIGGNMVWGHHPNRTSATPPTSGWQAPHSAPADPSMNLIPLGAGAPPQQPAFNGQAQAQQAQMQAQLQQQQQMLQMRQQQMQQQQQQQQQQQMSAQQNAAAQKAQWEAKMNQHRAAAAQQQEQRKQEMEQKKVEQQAIMAIRKVLMKLKSATPENWEALVGEIQLLVRSELEKCGSQAGNIKTECETALLAAKDKVDQMLELRRKSEERLQELQKQREEARETARKLLNELNQMVEDGEAEQKSLAESIKTLSERRDITTEAAVERALSKVETESESVLEKAAAALEFFRSKQKDMQIAPPPYKPPQEKKEDGAAAEEQSKEAELPNLQVLSRRAFALKAAVDKDASCLKSLKGKLQRRVEANDVLKKQMAVFEKYDKNKDKVLDKKEITSLAKTEYKFQMPEDALTQIIDVIVSGGKGVKFEDFSRLLTAIGIAREKAKDLKRREARLEREAELIEERKKIQAESDEVHASIKESTDFVNELLKQTRALPQECKEMTAVKMVERAADLEEQAKTGEDKVKAAQDKAEEFGKSEVDKDLDRFLQSEKHRLTAQAKQLDGLISSAKSAIMNFKTQAVKKDEAEVNEIAAKALTRLRAYQAAEKLSPAETFKKIAGDGDNFDKDQFVAFMTKSTHAKDGEEDISAESFGRAFPVLDEDKAGAVTAEALLAQLWNVMKVVHDVALTAQRSLEDATSLRIVQVGEAVEVLEGPVEEGELKRIRAKCLSDGTEGWLSLAGSKGTIFLQEGGNCFEVVKETILTECFEIEKASGKKDSTRKLKPGELLEARVWGKKQEESGLTRMKVKAKLDGLVGWVTTVGNTGIKFVEMV